MAMTVTVAGVDRTAYCQRFAVRRGINAIGTGTFVFRDPAASPWIPAAMDEVVVTVEGTVVFRGRILTQRVESLVDTRGAKATVQVADGNDRANLELLNTTAPGGTLKSILQVIMINLSSQNVVLAAGQADGPTLGPQAFAWVTCREALDHLSTLTGYLWRIDDVEVGGALPLEMWPVGGRASGLTFSAANANIMRLGWGQDVTGYRNIQWVIYGPTQADVPVTETWTNDGANRLYTMSYALNGGTPPAVVTRSDTGATVPVGPDTNWEWSYDGAANRLVHTGGTPVANGATLTASYAVGFPQVVVRQDSAEIAARGRWMRKDVAPEIISFTAAQTYADALLRNNKPRPARLVLQTRTPGADPGETCTVHLPVVGLSSASYLIEAATASYEQQRGLFVVFTLELIGGTERQQGWQDFWRELLAGTGASGGGAVGGVAAAGSALAPTAGAVYLGGSRSRSVQADGVGPPAGAPVVDHVPVTLDSARYPGGAVVVRCWVRTRDAGTSVTPTLVCLTTGATAGMGTATTSTAWVAQTFAATLVSGEHEYALYLVASNGAAEVLGIGYLE